MGESGVYDGISLLDLLKSATENLFCKLCPTQLKFNAFYLLAELSGEGLFIGLNFGCDFGTTLYINFAVTKSSSVS
jgi:hypothetical protein